jgi:ribose transport system substrate-binding protein
MNRRRSLALAALIVACSAFVALALPASGVSSSGAKKYRIGLVLPLLSNPAISPIRDGAVQAAKTMNAEVLVKGTNDPAEQNAAMMTYINLKVDALIFDPIDSAAVSPAVQKANSLGIPVIGVIGGASKGKIATLISPDWYKLGFDVAKQSAAGWCKSLNPCNVAIVGGANAPGPGLDSGKGIVAGLKTQKNAKLVQTEYTDYSAPKALNAAQAIISAHPDLNFISTWWSVGAISTTAAVRAANKLGKIGIGGVSATCPVLKDMFAGNVYNDVFIFSDKMGVDSLHAAISAIQKKTLPKVSVSPHYAVTLAMAKSILAGTLKPPAAIRPQVIARLKQAKAGKC